MSSSFTTRCRTSTVKQNNHPNCDTEHEQQIDNSVKILEKIAGLYAERLLSDIVLEVGGKQYASHRLILCASSDVFQVMLMNPNWSESQEKTIILQEEENCAKVFPEFLKYLYTGIIHINHSLVLPLVALADKYNVRDLVILCVEYMRKHIVSATKHNQLVSWLQYTLTCGHESITSACIDFVAWNFEPVSQMEDFINLETDVLITFLKKSDLVVNDEYTLFQVVNKWLEAQENKFKLVGDEFFDTMVPLVMSYIRFPMMEPRQLASLLINPIMIRYKEFFVNQMSLAMMYHSNGLTPHLRSKMPNLSFTPRLYTVEKWSSSLIIENYKNLPIYGVRTLVFNTPSSLTEWEQNKAKNSLQSDTYCPFEWVIDIYPKGVWFKKFYLIAWQGTLEMPESVYKTVRLSLSAVKGITRKVSIGILLSGKLDGIEYIHTVVQKQYLFTKNDKMLNIDNLINFDELNEVRHLNNGNKSPYLIGQDSDTLKIQIVITPLSDY